MSSNKVKCTCGWSWNKSDSSKKDMYVCHECGRDNSNNMKNGGWLDNIPQAQDGDTKSRYNIDVRRTNMIDYVPYYENVPSPEFDNKSVERAQRSAEAYNADVLRRYGPQNEYRTAKSAQKAAERLNQLKQTVEVTPIVNNKEEEKKLEKKLENDNDIEEKSSKSKKYNNKKPKRKKEKEDDNDDSDGEAFIPPFILNAPNYTGVKPQFYDNINNESKDNDGIVNLDTSAPSEVSYRDDISINSANYRNAQRLAGSNLGLQLLLNDKKYKKDDDVLKKETSKNEYNKSLSQEENKNVLNLNRSVNSNMFNRKLKNGGWLDSYADGGSMQEHQENYNNNSVSLPEGYVGEGYNTKGRDYSPAWGGQFEDGGLIPIAQNGRATRADSLAVFNNAKSVEDYFKKQGYIKEKVKDSKTYKESIKNNKELIASAQKWLKDAKNEPVAPWWTQAMKNKRIAEETKYLKNIQKRISEDRENINPKKYIKTLEESRKHFEAKPKDSGRYVDEQNNIVEGKPSAENFYLPIDENKFYQREQSQGFLDLRSPMPLYDKRITPQDLSVYKSPDSIKQDELFKRSMNTTNKKEQDEIEKQLKDIKYADNVESYAYDPLAVMPFDMVPPELQPERVKKYGLSGVPQSVIDAHPEWLKNTNQPVKTQTLQPMVEAVNLPPMQNQDPSFPKQELDLIRPIQAPKSYNVNMQRYNMQGPSDYYQANEEGVDYETALKAKQAADAYNKSIEKKYGNPEALKNPKAAERLKQLRQDVQLTPQYQMGGSVYPVNYVPQAQDGDIIPSDLPDPVNGIIYDPEGERTYYDDRLDRIVLTPSSNFSPKQSVINHEKFHKYQFDNLRSNYDIAHKGAVPLIKRPSMVASDEEYYSFHDRKPKEVENDIKYVKAANPNLRFVPDQLIFDKVVGNDQYSNPYSLEGEAQAYENSLHKYQMGGSIPGAVGFSYARTNNPAPSNGPYAKKTMASAQEGRTITVDEGEGKKRNILTDSSEYAKLYDEGRIGVQNDDESISFNPFNEVVVTPYDNQYPFYQELSDEEKKYFNSDSPIGRQLRSRAQDNVGFNADKATDFAMGWLRDLPLASLQAPQSALVEGVEALRGNDFNMLNALEPDKQRIPSETWGVENPYAAFAVDALTDPETLMGMSLLKNPLQKGMKQLRNIPTSISPELRQGLSSNGFLNTFKKKPNFQSGINTLEELPPLPEDLLTKLKKLQETSKAIDMVKQDLADPETIRRAEALGVDPEIFAEASKNMTYSSSRDVPSSYISNNLEININPNQSGRTPEEAIMSGVMNSHSPNFTSNEIAAHELGHFFQDTNYWKEAYPKTLDGLNRKLAQGMKGTPEGQKFLEYHPSYSTRDTAPTKVDEMLKDLEIRTGLDKEYYPQKNKNYFVDANKQYGTDVDNMIEKFPMFREYRQGMRDSGILKNKWDDITQQHIEDFRKLKPENRLNSFMEFNDKNYKLLNEVSKIAPAVLPIGLGLGAASQIEQKKKGGVIKDDRGQWAHPGEITEIGSNQITMQGVPYPVLGISDTGDTKLMKPGKNYKFKGKKVTEFPMAKNGLRQEQKGLVNLDQLTNFTNYNTKQPGGWLDKY